MLLWVLYEIMYLNNYQESEIFQALVVSISANTFHEHIDRLQKLTLFAP
jgi:hypothetical protein